MKKILFTFFIIAIIITTSVGVIYPNSVHAAGPGGIVDTVNSLNNTASDIQLGVLKAGANAVLPGLGGLAVGQLAPAVQTASAAAACLSGGVVGCAQQILTSIIQTVGNWILSMVSWLLWLSGIVFNFSIILLVVHMKDVLNGIPALFTVWKVLRDFANMFFIFILLYIAISTILGDDKWKRTLINVVLVALFLNFSFFITGLLIDASNIVALQFYNGFAGSNCSSKASLGIVETADGCMSWKIVQALKLNSIYDTANMTGNAAVNDAQKNGTSQLPALFIASNNAQSNIQKFIISIIAGTILMVIISGIFIASAVLIFYRFIELLVLLMISPIAFAFTVIPNTSKYFGEWRNRLVDNLIFAPAYFMFLWICMSVISSGNLAAVLGATGGFQGALSGGQDAAGVFGLLANYIIIILLLGYSLVLAKKLGAAGADQATAVGKAVGKDFQGWVGRSTVGRIASRIGNSDAMKDFRRDNPLLGRMVQKPFLATAGASFGGAEGGYEKAQKNFMEGEEKFAETLGPNLVDVRNAELKMESVKNANKPHEAEIKAAQEKFDVAKANENRLEALGTDMEVDGAAAKQDAINAKAELDRVTREKAPIIARISAEKKDAQEELDRLKGVDEAEAKKRATTDINEKAREGGYGGDEARVKKEISEMTKEIMEAKKGVAKINQEIFAKNVETGIGGTIATIVPSQVGKRFVSNVVNVVITDRHARINASNTIRKLIKGKSKGDQLIEAAKKEVKDEDSGGSDDEGGTTGGGGAPKTGAPKAS